MKSAVTISLVTEAKGGPFVFWDDLPAACCQAAELGYDAVELFAPGPEAVSQAKKGIIGRFLKQTIVECLPGLWQQPLLEKELMSAVHQRITLHQRTNKIVMIQSELGLRMGVKFSELVA